MYHPFHATSKGGGVDPCPRTKAILRYGSNEQIVHQLSYRLNNICCSPGTRSFRCVYQIFPIGLPWDGGDFHLRWSRCFLSLAALKRWIRTKPSLNTSIQFGVRIVACPMATGW